MVANVQAKVRPPKTTDPRDESVRGEVKLYNLKSQADRAAFLRQVHLHLHLHLHLKIH